MFGERVARMRWRPGSGRLVTIMAVRFGLTVVITRLYLMAAGILPLTVVNVLASYFSQFLTVFTAIAEALLLWLLIRYRTRYCSV
ncbi:hypothetical protein [Nocardia sp. NPDC004711]